VARRRARWKTHQAKLDPKRLVFIDETWAKTNMTRHPWAVRQRPAARRQGAARALAHAHLPRRAAS